MNIHPQAVRSAVHRRRGARALMALFIAILLTPTSAFAWWNHDWAYRKQIMLDTAKSGAEAGPELGGAAVLVRLHEGVFRFADAAPNGDDLRFVAGDDKTPLKFHVERYDDVFNLAFVWVQMPVPKAGAPTLIWMYYGNPKAVAESDARGTYDSNQTLVWHLSERGQPAADASGNGNNSAGAFASVDSGLIGGAAKVDEAAMSIPASATLALAANGEATWSLWVKPTAANADAVIYSQSDAGAGLRLGLAQGIPYVSVITGGSESARINGTAVLDSEHWHHLAFTSAKGKISLFVDGVSQATGDAVLPTLSGAASLGGAGPAATASTFAGQIDELEISKVARSPSLIKLAALNQGTEDKLVQFGNDEVASSWSTGYVGIIMSSVTLDGWVVIGILGIMAIISYIVMATKGTYTSRVNKANDLFTEQFRSIRADVTNLESGQPMNAATRKVLENSSMYLMYEVGRKEILHRFEVQGQSAALSAESIESIRASVDASLVRENQRLSKNLVLLTIAISGAPFLGLLGTVVGVMITFAGVAAAGEVNINAIAPGISAALLATVAGMMVAIPALFGYNYLLTRVKDIQANMTVFVDEFVTLMAEMYPASSYGHSAHLQKSHH